MKKNQGLSLGKFLVLTLLMAVLIPGKVQAAHTVTEYTGALLTTAVCPVYTDAEVTAPSLGQLPANTTLNACGVTDNGWFQIVLGDGLAIVHPAFVQILPVDAKTSRALSAQAAQVKKKLNTPAKTTSTKTTSAKNSKQNKAAAAPQAPVIAGNLIFVGDSRTGQMGNAVGGPAAFPGTAFISCFGGGYSWLSTEAAKKSIDEYVIPGSVIILNYGVNDLSNHQEYAELVNRYAADWMKKGAVVYYASVGPVGANEYNKQNWSVEYFNQHLFDRLSGSIGRIDLYSYLAGTGFTTLSDGLHYTPDTYAKMFNFLRSSIAH